MTATAALNRALILNTLLVVATAISCLVFYCIVADSFTQQPIIPELVRLACPELNFTYYVTPNITSCTDAQQQCQSEQTLNFAGESLTPEKLPFETMEFGFLTMISAIFWIIIMLYEVCGSIGEARSQCVPRYISWRALAGFANVGLVPMLAYVDLKNDFGVVEGCFVSYMGRAIFKASALIPISHFPSLAAMCCCLLASVILILVSILRRSRPTTSRNTMFCVCYGIVAAPFWLAGVFYSTIFCMLGPSRMSHQIPAAIFVVANTARCCFGLVLGRIAGAQVESGQSEAEAMVQDSESINGSLTGRRNNITSVI